MNPPIRFVMTSDDVRIACCTWGDGPPLVYVRGWMSNVEISWDMPAFVNFFEPFARHHRLVFYDSRANGLSDRGVESIDLDALVRDLEAVMDAHAPEAAVLYGHCFGGPIAIAYAERHPERVTKLILDGTYASGRTIAPREQMDRLLRMMREEPEAALYAIGYYSDPEAEQNISLAEHYKELRRTPDFVEMADAIKLYSCGFDVDVAQEAGALRLPTLVMHRRENRAVPFAAGRDLATRIPGAQFVAQHGSAANPWYGDAVEVQRAVASFLGMADVVADVGAREPSAPARPATGTMVILFTDIVASTSLTERMGDTPFRDAARALDAAEREAIREVGGSVVEGKVLGDGVLATFPSAAQAIEGARRCLNLSAASELGLHIGLHAGDVISEDNNVYGGTVNIAARICASSAPGEVLVSDVVRGMARSSAGVEFEDRGDQEMKGVGDAVRVYAVRWRT